MRKVKDVLRLKYAAHFSNRQIADSIGVARSTVADYLRRAEMAGLAWPLPDDLDEEHLDRLLFRDSGAAASAFPVPDWTHLHRELRRKGVTLQLLWHEYKTEHPDGYQYSRFCDLYRTWCARLDLVMRQDHRAGEKLFVDYAGQAVDVVDPETGEIRPAQIFVAVLGASNYTFAEATWTQSLRDWIASHVRAFSFFGGVPELIVPDNLKAGVSKAHRYEPDLNPTYQDLAEHYGMAVLPARVRKPRDKAKVEAGVLLVERWILAVLRHRTFFCLEELNETIAALLDRLNDRPFQKLAGESRRTLFASLERSLLRPLPPAPYVFAEWKKARAGIDYHVEVDHHYYSVPYRFARAVVDVRLTERTVECFLRGRRIASHLRSYRWGGHTTLRAHLPEAHRHVAGFAPERLIDWAAKTGPATAELIRQVIARGAHPQQGYRSALGILRLGSRYGPERLEGAARHALDIGAASYRSVESILKHELDLRTALAARPESAPPIVHANIRGADYYTMLTPNPKTRYEC
jgi:transposase